MTPEVLLEPGRPTATVQSVREAISAMVRVSADELADNLGSIVVTTSAKVLSGVKPVMEDEAFRKWFAGSVMVDGDGEPMVMYHGSYRDFTEFDRLASVGWRQRSVDTVGSWFSSSPGEKGAGMYATGVGAAIYPVYLSVKRPKHYDSFGELLAAMHEAEGRDPNAQASRGIGSAEGLRELLKLHGYDGIALARTNVGELTEELREAREVVRRARDEEYAAPKGERPIYAAKRERLEETVRRLEAEWRVCGGSTEFDGQTVVIAFEPEQIKSAIGNRGTYDAGAADIRHSLNPVEGNSLAALRASAVAARGLYRDFEREVAAGKEPDADTYFQLSTAVGDAEAAFAAALAELPDSDFSLKASTSDGRQLLLNRSAQRAGYYQLTRFAKDGAPWGDTQYTTKKKAVAEFLDEADVSTVVDFGGALARADAFDRWFGDSKVVDDQGKPLVVYHGTTGDFSEFSEDKIGTATDAGGSGRGFYFAADADYAGVYAGRKAVANIVPVYVSLKNPLHYEASGFGGRVAAIRSLGLEVPSGDPSGEWSERFAAAAKAKGYDGVLVTINGEPAEVVAFRPEQIKSAIGNRGTYDPHDPDIRHSLAAGAAGLDPRAQAFHDVATNTTVFLADRIPAGKEASVFLHETVHRHGRQALPEGRWDALVDQVKAWAQAGLQTPERAIHDAAAARVATAGVAGAVADEELFAYAVEEAVAMGIEPTAAAVEGSAEAWLQVVVESIQRVTDKLLGNDLQALGGQDLVDLAYALAQLDSPEHGVDVRRALLADRAAVEQEIKSPEGAIPEGAMSYE